MQKIFAVTRRELIAYFSSPLAYMVMTAFLLLQGLVFYLVLAILSDPSTPAMAPLEAFFGGTIFFWFYLLFVVPVITMRLVAEERRSGTLEVLLTSPLTEGQIIAGKFVAAFVFYIALWLPTALYVIILRQHSTIDMGPVLAGYLGVAMLGFLFLGIGTFASTLTENQLIAAILAFVGLIALFVAPLVEQLLVSGSVFKTALVHMNLFAQMEDYAMGIIDTRHIVYEVSVGLLFLFLATRSLELGKGR
ncbi:MAG: ABC transporter permease [Thermoanaerobaculales bacterium]|nr:ABC transporter permease [Thermoanaerobaculales bacterium]